MELITLEQKQLFDMMPTASGCKDSNSRFIHANQQYADIIGLNHSSEVCGRTDFDMPCETVQCAEMFRLQDSMVMEKGETMRILDVHPFSGGGWKVYIFSKAPLKDQSGAVIGTIFSGQDITSATSLKISSSLSSIRTEGVVSDLIGQNSYIMGSNFGDINLPERELDVLFLLLRGKSYKEIAIALKISSRTVETYVERMKIRFNVSSKGELVDKAISQGFLNTIPEKIFKKQMSLILE